ncbi:MCE family protein [Actinomycetospora sp. TBRC 11914]|uniref:MCE family protein n=1 Tax=Actinomycetospora sp. TBRC 11914 TaxID=2729387 RepID=UPI00289F5DD9|nr:MCE family protein [Actinomycetospora sp. TBRC 11914]
MKPFRKRNPIVIGAVSIIVLVLLVLASLNIRDLPLVGQGATYTARFAEAAGVQPDDDVRVAGIRVGTVTDVALDGNDVVISFKAPDAWIGDQTRASIEIKTLLGQKFIALEPAGTQPLNPDVAIPRTRTTAPFDVIDAFSQLTTTVEGVNTDQVAESLNTLSQTLDGASGPIRPALDGLSRLSQTISSRDAELAHLLANTRATTQVLAARDGDIATLIQNGNLLLGELRSRKAAIDDLLNGTIALSNQLRGLVADNRATLGPTLDKLNGVLTTLQQNSANLENGIRLFAPFVRVFGNVVGNGRWFDAYICNFDPPGDSNCVPNDSQNQLAFAQSLLGNLSPSPALITNAVNGLGQPLLQAGQAAGINLNTLFPNGVPLINPAAIGTAQGTTQAPAAAPAPAQGGGNR